MKICCRDENKTRKTEAGKIVKTKQKEVKEFCTGRRNIYFLQDENTLDILWGKYLRRAKWRSWQAPERHVVMTDTNLSFSFQSLFSWRILTSWGGWSEHVSFFYISNKSRHVSVGLETWEFDTWTWTVGDLFSFSYSFFFFNRNER